MLFKKAFQSDMTFREQGMIPQKKTNQINLSLSEMLFVLDQLARTLTNNVQLTAYVGEIAIAKYAMAQLKTKCNRQRHPSLPVKKIAKKFGGMVQKSYQA
jgi:hypothetical protein